MVEVMLLTTAMDKIVFNNSKGKVICEMRYNPDQNWIQVRWEGFADLETIKDWGESYLRLLEETGCPYLLNDDSKSADTWNSSLEWIENYLTPKAIERGLRYYAHVVSESAFAALDYRELNSRVADILDVASFKDIKDGKIWLIDMQEKDTLS